MFIYLSNSELFRLANQASKSIIVIDKSIIGKKEIISRISRGINSPYPEDNWDGFEESLCDLSWILNDTVRIIHQELPIMEDSDLKTYVSVLKTAVDSWGNSDKNAYRQKLQVYFPDSLQRDIEKII